MRQQFFIATKSIIFCLVLAFVAEQFVAEHGAAADNSDQKKTAQSSGASSATATSDKPELVHFLLHPAEPPYAALKYRLAATGIEKTPGNAAPNYMRAAMAWFDNPEVQAIDAQSSPGGSSQLDRWLAMPLDELSHDEAAQDFFNSRPTNHWDMLTLAARREQCDWDIPVREFNYSTLIPEVKKMRDLGRLLAFKARVEISRGQFDKAVETLNTGLALARHVGQAPTLVNALVGIKIAHWMLDQVALLVQQPRCPNLYWSLTALPNPLVDLEMGLGFERDFLHLYIPELRNVRTAVYTEAEWDKILLQVADKLMKVLGEVGKDPLKDAESFGVGAYFAVTAYPKAKTVLHDVGYTPSQIKNMCVSQAILTAATEQFESENDNIHKWFFADDADALRGLANAEHEVKELGQSRQEIIPLVSVLLPSLSKAKATQVELNRQLAALRCIEALRLYAAKHKDKLPQQLSDITEAPVPNDPSTGKPFEYACNSDSATLSSPAPLGGPASDGMSWEVRVAPNRN